MLVVQGQKEVKNEIDHDLLKRSINDLIAHYMEIEKKALCLPFFSIEPYGLFLWHMGKFLFLLIIDIALMVFYNIIVFFRNHVSKNKKKWSCRWFSQEYLKGLWLWIWRGEVLLPPVMCVQPVIRLLLALHFSSRLLLLRRLINLETSSSLDGPDKKTTLLAIDNALKLWRGKDSVLGVLNMAILAIPPSILTKIFSAKLSGLHLFLVFLLLEVLTFWGPFAIKRGLMLGGTESTSYFPGMFGASGTYKVEFEAFKVWKLHRRELPLDIILLTFISGLALAIGILQRFRNNPRVPQLVHPFLEGKILPWPLMAELGTFFLLTCFAYIRRKRLSRW